jgi:hypothetical protein
MLLFQSFTPSARQLGDIRRDPPGVIDLPDKRERPSRYTG